MMSISEAELNSLIMDDRGLAIRHREKIHVMKEWMNWLLVASLFCLLGCVAEGGQWDMCLFWAWGVSVGKGWIEAMSFGRAVALSFSYYTCRDNQLYTYFHVTSSHLELVIMVFERRRIFIHIKPSIPSSTKYHSFTKLHHYPLSFLFILSQHFNLRNYNKYLHI